MTATVSLDRSALSLTDLTISDTAGATYLLIQEGLGRPGITWRLTSAPDSADVHGTEHVAAVKEQTSLPLKLMVQADTAANLDAALIALEDALSQFTYTATVTVDGVSKVWTCGPAAYSPTSGLVDSSMVAQHFDVYSVTIPVYPIPGSV